MAIYLKRVKCAVNCEGCYFSQDNKCTRRKLLGYKKWKSEPFCSDFVYIQIEKPEEKQ